MVSALPACRAPITLQLKDIKLTVFEKLPVLGGMLTVGIPSYRLPRNIIEAEIQVMRDMGVEFKTGVEIGKDFHDR